MCRCYICNSELSEQEIQFDEQVKLEPCTTCLTIIKDAAYCDGFEPYPGEDTVTPVLEEGEEP